MVGVLQSLPTSPNRWLRLSIEPPTFLEVAGREMVPDGGFG